MIVRAIVGAIVAVLIGIFSKSNYYFIAGMVPLFPTFAILSNIVVAQDRSANELRQSVLFGMLSLIPYLAYLCTMYFLIPKATIIHSILASTGIWFLCALPLILIWNKLN